MMLSKRMTAKSLEAKPEIQASSRTVNVIRGLKPAAFVRVEDLICLVVDLLSGNMIFALADDMEDEDDDEEDDGSNCCCDDDDLFGNMPSRCLASAMSALDVRHRIYPRYQYSQRGVRHMCIRTPTIPRHVARVESSVQRIIKCLTAHLGG